MAKTRSVKAVAARAVRDDNRARAAAAAKGEPILGLPTRDSFQSFAFKMGIGTDSPLTKSTFGFNPVTRNRTLLEWAHRGSWVAGAAVDVIADDMTRGGVEQGGDIDPSDAEAIEEANVALNVWSQLHDNIAWARLYGGSIAVIMIDGQDPKTPLRIESVGKNSFRGLLVLDRWMVEPSMENLVTAMGPNLGLPKYYYVTASSPALPQQTIHYSRVIRAEGVRLPYQQRLSENMWGISILERIYDRLLAFEWASTGAAQLVSKAYLRTMKVQNLRDIIGEGGKLLDSLVTQMNLRARYQGMEGIDMIDAEDDFSTQTYSFAGVTDIIGALGQQVAGALQMPLVRLFGQEPSGLGNDGESALKTYYDGILQKQVRDLLTGTTLVYRVHARSLGITLPEGYHLKFRPLWQMTEEQKAKIAEQRTNTIIAGRDAGLVSDQVALKELKQTASITGVWSNIGDEDIDAASDEAMPKGEEVLPDGKEIPPDGGDNPDKPGKLPKNQDPSRGGSEEPTNRQQKEETATQDSTTLFKTSFGVFGVNVDYDVPLLGGSAKTKRIVYIDKDWDPNIKDGILKGMNRLPYLVEHEAVEKVREDMGDMYATAHYDYAEPAEHAKLLADMKVLPNTPQARRIIKAYEESYDDDLRACGKKVNPDLPPDMEDKPYEHPHNVRQRKLLSAVRTKDSITNVGKLQRIHGLHVVIENPKDSIRTGPNWQAVLPEDYGYIRKTNGADDDEVDCFAGPYPESEIVYVIDQRDLSSGSFDEHKCMIGFADKKEALDCYRRAYSDGKGGERVGAVSEASMEHFKSWLLNGDTTKPYSGWFNKGVAA